MRSTTGLAAIALALGCGLMPPEEEAAAQDPPARQVLPPPGYALVWEDEFQGTALDGVWLAAAEPRHDAFSTPDAVDVSGGLLTVTTWTDADGTHWTGFLTTEGGFEARYGYFEARIRFSSAPGNWCAFWLAAATIGDPLGDPGTAGVEIDVVEHRATDQGGWDALRDMVALNLNWDGYDENKKNVQRVMALPDGAPVQGTWHTYGVLWTATGYTFYVDGMRLWVTAAAISRRPQDVRLTCEVADGSWAGFVPPGGYGPRSASRARMEVDWVRVWQRPE
jgi:beta-glucanase (GH16 family)